MDEKIRKSWERFLDPEILRPNLIIAALYIAVFEMLKSTIAQRIRDFYTFGFDNSIEKDGGWLIDPEYQTKVLSKNRSRVYASLA